MRTLGFLWALIVLFPLVSQGQGSVRIDVPIPDSNDIYLVPKLASPIQFDGLPFEDAWRNIEPFELFQYEPEYGGEITDKTDLFMTYDDKYVYFAGRMYVDDPPSQPRGQRIIEKMARMR